MLQDDLAGLTGDLERREVPPETHPAGSAEHATEGAAGLRGDAEGPPGSARDQD